MKRLYIAVLIVLCISPIAFGQLNMDLRDVLPYPERISDVWGYADTSGNEYALVGSLTGLSIVDITNPDSIYEIQFIPCSDASYIILYLG